jgi:hypothetical protein
MIYSTISTDPYPIHRIELKYLNAPIDISTICAKENVLDYVYTFEYIDHLIDELLKAGLSYNSSGLYGERGYRQAGHLPGWINPLVGSSGSDMTVICNLFYNKYGKYPHKDNVIFTVHDLTNVTSPSIAEPYFHVEQLERKLIREYEGKHGRRPIGNIKSESHVDRKTIVHKDIFNLLFASNDNA